MDTAFQLLGPDHKIEVGGVPDPKVSGSLRGDMERVDEFLLQKTPYRPILRQELQ